MVMTGGEVLGIYGCAADVVITSLAGAIVAILTALTAFRRGVVSGNDGVTYPRGRAPDGPQADANGPPAL